jgi:4-diphosphocytidyl-2-C-methyl-D-erythritol kinase
MTVLRALYDVPAPAKLNLFLHIVGRREDGYHLLQSVFVLIDWADRLHFERRSDGRLRRDDLGAELPPDDLCLRAARALQSASGTPWGVDIAIDKQVPWGAGLGGGSSDAASTLLALNRLWDLQWPRTRLAALALGLGADVPFFVGGSNAFVEGIGERLTPVTVQQAWYAVIKPPVAIETRVLFAHPLVVRDSGPVIVAGSFDGDQGDVGWQVLEAGRNDLQAAAQDRCAEVAQAARWLEARYGNSRMTGSGSAVFAKAGTGNAPLVAFSAIELPPGWVGRMCRGLAQHPLRDWAT